MNIAELYPRYFDELLRYAISLTRNRSSAEDIAQETFLRAMTHSHILNDLSEVKARAWLYTTAKNLVVDHARRTANAPLIIRPDRHEDDLSAILVQSVMRVLTPEEHRLISLRHFADLNSIEIGKILGVSPATVRTRLRAAVKKLRAAYLAEERGKKK